MNLKTLYVRFYKSFNYDYLRKSHPDAQPDPWDTLQDGLFYPFVRVPLERQITTVVGANESGKSQLLSAAKCLLTGEKILRRDFCRYSAFFSVDKEMAVPEFGGEFDDLSDTESDAIRQIAGLPADASFGGFHFFRFNKRNVLFVSTKAGWTESQLTAASLKKIAFPTFFQVDAGVPLPDSVPLDYLVAPGSMKTPRSRAQLLRWTDRLRQNISWFSSSESVQKAAAKITEAFSDDSADDSDDRLLARLQLADDLLVRVAGIDRSAFEELRDAVKGAEGYANGIVDKMNQQLADALNFPKWWSQDSEFSLYLTLRDFDLVFTVRDRTGSDYAFSERSGGMSYFLSYFVQYLSHVPTGGQEILLMDEPDAYLSSSGQQDLLKIFDSFANPDSNGTRPVQVIYVTHSPFLIDRNHAERLRVLEKGEGEEGTRVVGNAVRNHYEPLRSTLGAFVAESTFIGNCNLVLEGQADQVLLVGVSSISRRLGRSGDRLDLNTLSLVPAGSAEHIPYLVYLARGRDVDTPAVIVLLDSDGAGQDVAAELHRGYRGRRLVDASLVIQVADVVSESSVKTSTTGVLELEDLLTAEVAGRGLDTLREKCLPRRRQTQSPRSWTRSYRRMARSSSRQLNESLSRRAAMVERRFG